MEYLTIQQLSEYAHLHKNVLRKMCQSGLVHYRIGRRIRVRRSDFDAFMEQKYRAEGTETNLKDIFREALKEVR